MRNANKILVGKPGSKRPFEKSRRRWEENFRISLKKEIRREGVDWIHLSHDMG
jgi:hypothetical protein